MSKINRLLAKLENGEVEADFTFSKGDKVSFTSKGLQEFINNLKKYNIPYKLTELESMVFTIIDIDKDITGMVSYTVKWKSNTSTGVDILLGRNVDRSWYKKV